MSKKTLICEEPVITKINCQDYCSLISDLSRAAIDFDIVKFDCIFSTKEHSLLSVREKVEGLELLGSTHILNGKFQDGFECWLRASCLRSGPRIPLPKADLPPVTSQFANPEWTTCEDFVRMTPESGWEWTESDESLEVDDKELKKLGQWHLVYQAMLVRLRYCKSESRNDVGKLKSLIFQIADIVTADESVTYFKYALLLLEWDKLYASSHHHGNKDGISAFDKMDRHVWNVLFSLQAQCARVLRRESMIPFNMKAVASIIVELSDSFSFN